jgi:hypothetical protein
MPDPIVIDVDEQGNIGTLPEPVQAFVNKAINEAFKRGAQKVEREMSGRSIDPAERERLNQAVADANLLREEIATRDKNFEEAARLREERFQRELDQREQTLKSKETEIGRRDARLRGMLGAEIRAAAVAAGAREESLPELQKLLGADLDLDENLDPFVKGEGNAPKLDKDGKPVSIEGLVREYLASHPHHLAGGRSQSGRAQGGAAIGRAGVTSSPMDESMDRLAQDPSLRNVTGAVRTLRQRAAGAK